MRVVPLAAALVIGLPSGHAAPSGPARDATAAGPGADAPAAARFPTIAILCYHDISDDPKARLDAVPPDSLRAHIRRAKANGWTFVRLSELIAARARPETLPARAMALTFDDGYRSFLTRALPILREEGVPATLAVVSDFVEHPPEGTPPILTWKEIAEIARAGDVEIASHSHGLHNWVRGDPQGGTSHSVTTRRYMPAEERYEDRDEYWERIRSDMRLSRTVLHARLGLDVAAYVWPFGEHNAVAREIAASEGFTMSFALGDRPVGRADFEAGVLPRFMVHRGQPIAAAGDDWLHPSDQPIRAAQADLDQVWDDDPETFRHNLDRLIADVRRVGATHVILQACPDPKGDGFLHQTWFVNHQTSTRADIWAFAASRFKRENLKVWLRAPSLNLAWAWERHPEMRIPFRGPRRGGKPWYFRVSPDDEDARQAALDFYGDIAVYLPIDGVLFDDDAYMLPGERLSNGDASASGKAAAIREHLEAIKQVVRAWRPHCKFGRNLYAKVVERPGLSTQFAQDLDQTLRDDDLAVVMAYAHMEGQGRKAERWMASLARTAAHRWQDATRRSPELRSHAIPPILFKLQAYDWERDKWLKEKLLVAMARAARKEGIVHLGVYPVVPDQGELANDLLLVPAEAPASRRQAPSRHQAADTP